MCVCVCVCVCGGGGGGGGGGAAGANAKKMLIWVKNCMILKCVCVCVWGGGGLVCNLELPLHTGLFRIFTGNTLYSQDCKVSSCWPHEETLHSCL